MDQRARSKRAGSASAAARVRTSRLAVAGLIGLLALLGALQWRWVGEVSRLERERTRRSLSEAGERLGADLDRELLRAFFYFQLGPRTLRMRLGRRSDLPLPPQDVRPSDSERAVADQLALWRQTAPTPGLIREVYRVGDPSAGLLRCTAEPPQCLPAAWPAELGAVRERIESGLEGPEVEPRAPALLLPTRLPPPHGPRGPFPPGAEKAHPSAPGAATAPITPIVVVWFDRDLLATELLPALAERYFHLAKSPELRLAVVGPEGVIYSSDPKFEPKADAGDLWLPLFGLRGPVDFHRLLPELLHGGPADRGGRGDRSDRAERLHREIAHAFLTDGFGSPLGGSGSRGAWMLAISNRAGSLEAAVTRVRERNLAISLAILGLLAASLLLLARSAARAHRLAEQRLEFVAGVTHELHTPIAAIRAAAQNLADGVVVEPPRVREYGALVDREGARLSSLVAQALELAGIESGTRAFHPEPLAVSEAIDRALGDAGPALSRAGLEVERDAAAEAALPPALADRAALRLALRNLLENAAKYAASGGKVVVRAARTGGEGSAISLIVEDRGPGVAPEDRAGLFVPFERGRAASTLAGPVAGAGLGLALSRRALAATGGTLAWREGPNGSGSAFEIRLPVAPVTPVTPSAASPTGDGWK